MPKVLDPNRTYTFSKYFDLPSHLKIFWQIWVVRLSALIAKISPTRDVN
jgi:hypothetical protein